MGWRKTLSLLRWGPAFRMHRRILQKSFQKSNIVQYRALREREPYLPTGARAAPGRAGNPAAGFATAVVMSIGFGVEVRSDDDRYIQMAVDASYALGHGGAPAGTLVDFFPIFKSFPSWLVRNRALKFARDWRWAIRQIHDAPYAAVLEERKSHRHRQQKNGRSLVHALLEQRQDQLKKGEEAEMTEEDVKGAAGAVYAAGRDTTWSSLVVWILNMVLHPEIQAKARGREREREREREEMKNPAGSWGPVVCRPSKPGQASICRQPGPRGLRWCPVSPIGVPHRSQGPRLPRHVHPEGSFVYANAGALTHDERVSQHPDDFDPDRYLPVEQGGRGEAVYGCGSLGFGRRICVGKHLAEASMWIIIASVLAAA